MPFTDPNYNLFCDLWQDPNIPGVNPADFTGIPCQLYRDARAANTFPTAIIRVDVQNNIPIGPTTTGAVGNPIVECPQASGAYYRIENMVWMHRGFPNEYIAWRVSPIQPTRVAGNTIASDRDLT